MIRPPKSFKPQENPRCTQCGFGDFPGHELALSVRYCDVNCKYAAYVGLKPAIYC